MTVDKTRIKKTEAKYLKRAQGIVTKYEKLSGHNYDQNTEAFCDYLIDLTKGKTQSNLRQIKASCAYFATVQGHSELSKAICNLPSAQATSKSQGNNTSSQKKKHISHEDELKIHNYILGEIKSGDDGSFWNKPTFVFFKAGLAVGLRPIEWQSSELLNEATLECEDLSPPILKVKNGKSTNGRSYGEFRYIGIAPLPKQDIAMVKEAIRLAKHTLNSSGTKLDWEDYYSAISGRLYNITKRLFPRSKKRPTLYSCRHQHIANLKSAGYPLIEIACLSGHLTDVTATEHYGKRRFGNKDTNLPVANPKDLGKIKQMFGQHKPSMAPATTPSM